MEKMKRRDRPTDVLINAKRFVRFRCGRRNIERRETVEADRVEGMLEPGERKKEKRMPVDLKKGERGTGQGDQVAEVITTSSESWHHHHRSHR